MYDPIVAAVVFGPALTALTAVVVAIAALRVYVAGANWIFAFIHGIEGKEGRDWFRD